MQPLFAFFQAFIAIFLCSHKKSAIFSAIFITVFCHKPSSSCLQYTTDRACIPQEILKIENNLSFRHTLPPKIVIRVKGDDRHAGLAGCGRRRSIRTSVFGHDPAAVLHLFARPGGEEEQDMLIQQLNQAAQTAQKPEKRRHPHTAARYLSVPYQLHD